MNKKEKLLSTGYFIDNLMLMKYIKLVSTTLEYGTYLEKHHIIPRSYFKIKKLKIDNSKENVVRLSYYNHILAHYYLCLCTIGKLHNANVKAFTMMVDCGNELLTLNETKAIKKLKNYIQLQKEAVYLKKITCKQLGTQKKDLQHRLALRKARDLHSTTKGKKSVYNKTLNKVKFVTLEEVPLYIKSGWSLGGKPMTTKAKLKIGISNSQALKGKRHQIRKVGKLNSGLIGNKIKCIETGQIFENINMAKKWLQKNVGIDGGQIKNCCAGQRESTGGYHWSFVKEEK